MAQQYNLTDSDSSDSEAQFEVGRLFELRQIRGYSKDPEVRSYLFHQNFAVKTMIIILSTCTCITI